jgi:hypothetical protein
VASFPVGDMLQELSQALAGMQRHGEEEKGQGAACAWPGTPMLNLLRQLTCLQRLCCSSKTA